MLQRFAPRSLIYIVALASLALPEAGVSQAATPTPGPTVPLPASMHFANGWYFFDRLAPMVRNPREVLEQGTRMANGSCEFVTTMTITPGSPGVGQQEVASNPATCQRKMLRGVLLVQHVTARPRARVAVPNSFCEPPIESKGHAFAKYTDPLNINVTSQHTYTDWYSNNCIVTGLVANTKNNDLFAGWFNDHNSWNNSSWNTTYTTSDSYTEDYNPIFANINPLCSPGITWTTYRHNASYGWWNGNLSGYWDVYDSGSCTWLLSESQSLTYDF